MPPSQKPFEDFLEALKKATNETQKRELFVGLAKSGFADTDLATDLALGAEYKVRFKSSGLVRRGAVDAFFGNLVVEFEYDLAKTEAHARDQLRAYVAGAWYEDGDAARPYLAVVTDGARWKVYAPQLSTPDAALAAESVMLGEPIEEWAPTDKDDGASLQAFLNRLFFRKTLLKPTTENFAKDFGLSSPAYIHAETELRRKLNELANDPQLTVLRGAWKTSLQFAYGSVETDDELFAKHTYLAALARLLVWTAFERRALKADEIESVLSGLYFRGKRIANLVEDDFFRWDAIASATDAKRVWLGLSRQLVGYDLAAIKEDILKPLYEELVDPTTKHELGEFYTPDWLATLVVQRLLQDHDWKTGPPSLLDPACGSGTFLRAAIEEVRSKRKELKPAALLNEILSSVMGIDVHPLAVTIARATYLLATKDLIAQAKGPTTLPVFLANALSMPPLKRQKTLHEEIVLEVNKISYGVPIDFVYHGADYDLAIEEVLRVSKGFGQSGSSLDMVPESFKAAIGSKLDAYGPDLVKTLGQMAKQIADLIQRREDSVHGFLLKNHYRPSMLRNSFDYVMGNPPWLTVSRIETPAYKDAVIRLSAETDIAPRSQGDQSHTNIALVFLTAAVGHFLKSGKSLSARIGFVMPHALFTARHNRNLREGLYVQDFDVVELWDLSGVSPLFNIPSCAIFVAASTKARPKAKKDGLVFEGKLTRKDAPGEEVAQALTAAKTKFELRYMAKRSSWVVEGGAHGHAEASKSKNAYQADFRQGAILYPQTLLVVRPSGKLLSRSGSVRVVTDPDATDTAKVLRDVKVDHMIDAANLFATAAADHLLPFTIVEPLWTVVLPTPADPGQAAFGATDATVLRRMGRVDTAGWLDWAEARWKEVRKEGESSSLSNRLDTFGHLAASHAQKRFVVLYTAAGKRAVAAVVDTKALALPLVPRDRTFWASFDSKAEAHYVAAFLNSDYVAGCIAEWVNKGLFGLRDINKRVLDVAFPRFDPQNPAHRALAQEGELLAKHARSLLPQVPKGSTGRRRNWMRKNLEAKDLALVERTVTGLSKKA